MLEKISEETRRRRTFAIISHPDAGKTTLTEKLLFFGGAIQLAGAVRARKNGMQTRSDWMKIERERGISVVTSVVTFEHEGKIFNILDTPGHEDFADDTYRTLTAVDFAIMVIDAARGIEPRTLKLFEICRLRNIPIITFINKMDRETRDPFIVLDEIEKKLALDAAPLTWPVGLGKSFIGTCNQGGMETGADKNPAFRKKGNIPFFRAEDLLPENERKSWSEARELAQEAYSPFNTKDFLNGSMTPVLFGSALRNLGMHDLIDTLKDFGPSPGARETNKRMISPDEEKMTAFVFRIQANMDPRHRDRIAFVRICSGKLTRGMKAKLTRTGKLMTLSAPQFFFAQNRRTAEEAFAGDVVGIPNHGHLRIGDTLTEEEDVLFHGIPDFSPEILRRIRTKDSIRTKKLKEALQQMSEEGAVQLFFPEDGSSPVAGVIGALQLDVLHERLKVEYGLEAEFEPVRFTVCRWIEAENTQTLNRFIETHRSNIARDRNGDHVFLTENMFLLNYESERWKEICFMTVKGS